MIKVLLKVDMYDDRTRQKAMKTVSGISGVESVSVDMKDKKMTLIGEIDPVSVVGKLRKWCRADIVSVGPAKEEKKEEPKKTDEEKGAAKVPDPFEIYPLFYPMKPQQYYSQYYYSRGVEEDPNACVIC